MALLWGRKLSLIVGDDAGDGLELNEMHIVFAVRHGIVSTPKNLVARIYNLSDSTAQRIKQEFTRIVLQAGYEAGPYGPIFDGTIKQVRRGHENSTDSYVDIFAADADQAYNWATMNSTLAAGYTPRDQYAAIGQSTSIFGVTRLPSSILLPTTPAPRGRVLWGMARDHAEDLANTHGMTWNMRDGGLYYDPVDPPAPDSATAIVLNSNTGLVGFPEQTQDGIVARCLLRPDIHAGTIVHIDNKSVIEAAQPLNVQYVNTLPSIAEDGFYRVIFRDNIGDTRGQPWYTEMVCQALTGQAPISSAVTQAIPD